MCVRDRKEVEVMGVEVKEEITGVFFLFKIFASLERNDLILMDL